MVIGDYRIIEKIGEGGMGIIYKAEHCALEQIVAIKTLPGTLSVNSDLRERFIREAKIQARLSHPNVVNILNFFEFERNFYIVMEYVEGETLEALIKNKGLLPPDSCTDIFKQILAGIGYAHSMGIIHRDVKPSNIIIKKDGSVKITDFGIAKIASDLQKTQEGVKVGTLWYMSPEQVKGQPATTASDIYSLGVTLFEMITGKVPFAGNSEYTIMRNIVECPPPSPREFYPYVPLPLENTILKAIAKEPADRFGSVQEFDAALTLNFESTLVFSEEAVGIKEVTDIREGVRNETSELKRQKKGVIALSAVVVSASILLCFYLLHSHSKQPAVASTAFKIVNSPRTMDPKTAKLGSLLKKAQTSLDNRDFKSAITAYGEALKIDPTDAGARSGLDMAAKALEKRQNRAVALDCLVLARAYHREGKYGKAIDKCKKALLADPENKEVIKAIKDARSARSAEEMVGTLR